MNLSYGPGAFASPVRTTSHHRGVRLRRQPQLRRSVDRNLVAPRPAVLRRVRCPLWTCPVCERHVAQRLGAAPSSLSRRSIRQDQPPRPPCDVRLREPAGPRRRDPRRHARAHSDSSRTTSANWSANVGRSLTLTRIGRPPNTDHLGTASRSTRSILEASRSRSAGGKRECSVGQPKGLHSVAPGARSSTDRRARDRFTRSRPVIVRRGTCPGRRSAGAWPLGPTNCRQSRPGIVDDQSGDPPQPGRGHRPLPRDPASAARGGTPHPNRATSSVTPRLVQDCLGRRTIASSAEATVVLRTCRAQRTTRRHRPAWHSFATPMVVIEQRPAESADRLFADRWAGGLIMGAGNRSAIGILVERTTLLQLPNKHRAEHLRQCPPRRSPISYAHDANRSHRQWVKRDDMAS